MTDEDEGGHAYVQDDPRVRVGVRVRLGVRARVRGCSMVRGCSAPTYRMIRGSNSLLSW